jgi:hypothetical protein
MPFPMSRKQVDTRALREKNGNDSVKQAFDSLAEQEGTPYNEAKEESVHSHTTDTGSPREWRKL